MVGDRRYSGADPRTQATSPHRHAVSNPVRERPFPYRPQNKTGPPLLGDRLGQLVKLQPYLSDADDTSFGDCISGIAEYVSTENEEKEARLRNLVRHAGAPWGSAWRAISPFAISISAGDTLPHFNAALVRSNIISAERFVGGSIGQQQYSLPIALRGVASFRTSRRSPLMLLGVPRWAPVC